MERKLHTHKHPPTHRSKRNCLASSSFQSMNTPPPPVNRARQKRVEAEETQVLFTACEKYAEDWIFVWGGRGLHSGHEGGRRTGRCNRKTALHLPRCVAKKSGPLHPQLQTRPHSESRSKMRRADGSTNSQAQIPRVRVSPGGSRGGVLMTESSAWDDAPGVRVGVLA